MTFSSTPKVIAGVIIGLTSLTTTAVAGYRVYENSSLKAKVLGSSTTNTISASATPEVKEVTENDTEVVTIPSSATPSPTPTTETNLGVGINLNANSPSPIPSIGPIMGGEKENSEKFDDKEDDFVNFRSPSPSATAEARVSKDD